MPSGREYDALAFFYDRYWGARFHDASRPAMERLLYSQLTEGDCVLELCCGSGHLTQELAARGYRVTGIDCSHAMLRYGARRAPSARFVCGDVERSPLAGGRFAAVVSTFDSVNHLIARSDLDAAIRGAAAVLAPEGLFVFDVNSEEAYRREWQKSSAIVEPDAALFVRGGYDAAARMGRTTITMFHLDGVWQRSDVTVHQRPYDVGEMAALLTAAGLSIVAAAPASEFGMAGDIGVGRAFIAAQKR